MRTGTGISLGIDVGEHRSWYVAMSMDGRSKFIQASEGPIIPKDLPGIIGRLRPEVVAIDAPRCWAKKGNSRLCERELHGEGTHCFFTPVESKSRGNDFYGWVRTGLRFYDEAAKSRVTAIEVFPHAAEDKLLPSWRAQKSKVRRRRNLLRAQGVARKDIEEHCSNIHRTDAAVCALVGLLHLAGQTKKVGNRQEGEIIVPS
jgi:predicted nuclease with RNAse H fold